VRPRASLEGCGKSRPPPEFDPQTIQPLARCCTNWAVPTELYQLSCTSPQGNCSLNKFLLAKRTVNPLVYEFLGKIFTSCTFFRHDVAEKWTDTLGNAFCPDNKKTNQWFLFKNTNFPGWLPNLSPAHYEVFCLMCLSDTQLCANFGDLLICIYSVTEIPVHTVCVLWLVLGLFCVKGQIEVGQLSSEPVLTPWKFLSSMKLWWIPKLSSGKLGTVKCTVTTEEFAVGLGSCILLDKANYPSSVTSSPPHTLCRSTLIKDSTVADSDLYKQTWCNSALLRVLYLRFNSWQKLYNSC
jgi:hypothetical protein